MVFKAKKTVTSHSLLPQTKTFMPEPAGLICVKIKGQGLPHRGQKGRNALRPFDATGMLHHGIHQP
jgi:hypothetical protein